MTKTIKILEKPTEDQVKQILQSIANFYHNPESIVYEYIQNSIDSAIEIKRENKGRLPRKILVHIDYNNKGFVVQDDCLGMSESKMESLPKDVFYSTKKKYPWVTGQFGYGIQSFRAWFSKIEIISKQQKGSTQSLIFNRGKSDAQIEETKMKSFGMLYNFKGSGSEHSRTSGTDVFIGKISKKRRRNTSFDYIAEKLIRSIPIHFENFIKDGTVEIILYIWRTRRGRMWPTIEKVDTIDYEEIPGEKIDGDIKDDQGETFATYYFKIVESDYLNANSAIRDYCPRLTRLGTRINELAKLNSFIRYSEKNNLDTTIWERPEIIGKVDILKKIDIDMNRADLTPSEDSESLYSKIAEINKLLKDKLEEIKKTKIRKQEESFAEIISDVFTDVSKDLDVDFYARKRKILSTNGIASNGVEGGSGIIKGDKDNYVGENKAFGDSTKIDNETQDSNINSKIGEGENKVPNEEKEEGDTKYKEIKQRGLEIKFEPLGETFRPSDMWGGKTIAINSDHPLYKERLDSHKREPISKRLIGYLAIVTTPWFLDQYYKRKGIEVESKEKNWKIVEITAKVEKALWDKRRIISKKVAEVEDGE